MAQITNGSFETGNFSGWTQRGDTLIQNVSLGISPPDGSYTALLATATDGTVNGAVPAGVGVSQSSIETFCKIPAGTLSGHGTGLKCSAIEQDISMLAGQKITVQWSFLTNQTYNDGTALSISPDLTNNDFGFATVVTPANVTKLTKLGDVNSTFSITNAACPFIASTGFQTFSFTATTTGTYSLSLGVVHASTATQDNGVNSALLIDSIQFASTDLSRIVLLPASVIGGNAISSAVVLTVTPTSSTAVTLSSNNTAVQVPSSVSVLPSDGTTKHFTTPTQGVDTNQVATITATLGSTTQTTTVTITPATMDNFHMTPTSIQGGHAVTGIVHLNGFAGPSGVTVTLSSDTPGACSPPASVFIPSGSQAKSFTIATHPVGSSTAVSVTATYGSSVISSPLTVTP